MSDEDKPADVVQFEKPRRGPEYWGRKLGLLGQKAQEAGREEMKAFVGAFIAFMPGILEQVGSRDLAAAIRVRFFEPMKPPTIPETPSEDAN